MTNSYIINQETIKINPKRISIVDRDFIDRLVYLGVLTTTTETEYSVPDLLQQEIQNLPVKFSVSAGRIEEVVSKEEVLAIIKRYCAYE